MQSSETTPYAYVTARSDDGISVLNIADPTSPTLAGSTQHRTILDYPSSIMIRGDYAFVAGNGYFVSVIVGQHRGSKQRHHRELSE